MSKKFYSIEIKWEQKLKRANHSYHSEKILKNKEKVKIFSHALSTEKLWDRTLGWNNKNLHYYDNSVFMTGYKLIQHVSNDFTPALEIHG